MRSVTLSSAKKWPASPSGCKPGLSCKHREYTSVFNTPAHAPRFPSLLYWQLPEQFPHVHLPCTQALPPKPFPKLSVKLLDDVAPDGPLHLVAVHCHNIVKQRGLKRVDFSNPGRRKEVRPRSASGCGTC